MSSDLNKNSNANSVQVLESELGPYFLFYVGKEKIEVHVEFARRKNIGGHADILSRAIGLKDHKKKLNRPMHILDITAGLCRDAFHFHCLGCEVTAVEQNDLIFEVVNHQLKRLNEQEASEQKLLGQETSSHKISLVHQSAQSYLQALKDAQKPDVIYYDPMFPDMKKTAKAGKESQLLQLLAHTSSAQEEFELLQLALGKAKKRVVVKRPLQASRLDELAQQKSVAMRAPIEFKGKAIRYDVYIV